ncbi:putative sugar O-methyltransferase [Nodosilinea sp. E11]|uniref:putative sugar O-methyltransferase n=1 Tax=Nodosilinea sp. E11 TaxID=3037479 RepID=UPI0029344D8B|nr:putative sugar O-methyltransferase [Nodosilinea sp. E11]WOD40412.1 putative sugar O-methyltransferase [Nodosilinea sp. E11]
MIKKFFKKILLFIPLVKKYTAYTRQNKNILAENKRLQELIKNSRSPGLFDSPDDFLTERLLAHPAKNPLPSVNLSSQKAVDGLNRAVIADRLIKSYHKALEDEKYSLFRQEGEDLWTDLVRNELPELMETIDQKDPEKLGHYLMEFGQSFVWFGGITTCVDGYNRNLDPRQVALTYWDKLVCLAECLGVVQFENPENGPWGDILHFNMDELLYGIEQEIGIDISLPLGIIYTDGLKIGDRLFHYRHINSLYSAIRIARLNCHGDAVCEFGGGLGMTAVYARRLGFVDYTIFDLPITCLLAGHYLMHAVGEASVCLYGETATEGSIKVLPYWECAVMPDNSFGLTVNQDSFPEISDNLISQYLLHIKRSTKNYFLSINHECFYPRTVRKFTKDSGGYEPVYRSKCWVREGYLEEVFRISK